MKFRLTDDQQALQEMLRRIVATDAAHRGLRAVIDGASAIDAALWRQLVEFGLAGLVVDETYGGAGLTMVELGLAAEVLGHAGVAVPFFGHALATLAIGLAGSEEQQARLLPALAAGERLATIALEGSDGWGPAGWTLAEDAPVTARFANVPHGLDADLLVIGGRDGALGVIDLAQERIARRAMDGIDRTRPLAVIEASDAAAEWLTGTRAGGAVYDAALALLAADAFGGATRCLAMTTDYGNLREAFGAKLTQFQAYKHQLATMALEIEPCRGLYWYAVYACAHLPERASHAAALAKAHIGEVFARVSRLAIELHGGIGFTWEHDAHIWMKRAMFDFAWGGGTGTQLRRAADLAGW